MISKFLIERALDLLPIASSDASRMSINGVMIVADKGKVAMVATDGHKLIERKFEGTCPNGKYMLYKDEAPALKLVLKEHKHAEEIEASIDLNGGLFIGMLTKARISKYEIDYPDYRTVIPTHTAECAITINAEYLYDIAKSLQDGEKRKGFGIRIVFDPTNPLKAVLIQQEGLDGATAVCMPMRDGGTKAIAQALADQLAKANKAGAA